MAAGSASLFLRLASLVGKLALSLYMAKIFALSELGLYGLAFGAVMLAVVGLGFRIDYVVAREILGMKAEKQRGIGTAVGILYLASFFAAAPLLVLAISLDGSGHGAGFFLLIYLLCGIEAYANFLYTVTIALKRPALANGLFFIRSGLWTVPAMAMSYLNANYRTAEFVLLCWLAGAAGSVALNLWLMRGQLLAAIGLANLPWRDLRSYIRTAVLVWIGSIGITLGFYLDRFVLASFLSLEDVGVATFYTSFTGAVLTLVQSATTSITFPRMIDHFDAGHIRAYRDELRRTALLAVGISLIILFGLAIAMHVLGHFLSKPELVRAYPAFLLLLVATFVRSHGESLYYGLFVERRHRAIWVGNLLFLAASFLFNLALIPWLGLIGLGLASVASAAFITAWRWWTLRRPIEAVEA